jgi:hypothetical protein
MNNYSPIKTKIMQSLKETLGFTALMILLMPIFIYPQATLNTVAVIAIAFAAWLLIAHPKAFLSVAICTGGIILFFTNPILFFVGGIFFLMVGSK